MMKVPEKLLAVLAGGALALSLVACGGEDESSAYKNNHLPSEYRISLPQSLKTANSASGKIAVARKLGKKVAYKAITRPAEGTAFGFEHIKTEVEFMNSLFNEMDFELLILDAVMPQILAQLGAADEVLATDLKVKITQAMVNTIKQMLAEYLDASELEFLNQIVGEELYVPDMAFKKLSGDPAYDFQVDYTDFGVEGDDDWGYDSIRPAGGGEDGLTRTVKWNAARNRISAAYNMAMGGGSGSMTTTFDGTAGKKMTFAMDFDGMGTYSVELIEKNPAKKGVQISDRATLVGMSFEVEGYADDDGGYLNSRVTIGEDVFEYRETFNGAGAYTGMMVKDPDSGEWVPVDGYDPFDDDDWDDEWDYDWNKR